MYLRDKTDSLSEAENHLKHFQINNMLNLMKRNLTRQRGRNIRY